MLAARYLSTCSPGSCRFSKHFGDIDIKKQLIHLEVRSHQVVPYAGKSTLKQTAMDEFAALASLFNQGHVKYIFSK